jgi:hypothetical protein
MPTFTNWFVVVTLEVAGKEKQLRGPRRGREEEAKQDLDAVRHKIASGEWLDLDWISANPKHFVAAHISSTSVGFA